MAVVQHTLMILETADFRIRDTILLRIIEGRRQHITTIPTILLLNEQNHIYYTPASTYADNTKRTGAVVSRVLALEFPVPLPYNLFIERRTELFVQFICCT